jgi:hypothetical protein
MKNYFTHIFASFHSAKTSDIPDCYTQFKKYFSDNKEF